MKRIHWSASAALATVAMASLALAPAAAGNHGVTDLASLGPVGGNGPANAGSRGVSPDGRHVFFQTSERLVSADTDNGCGDLYEHADGTTTLVSIGPTQGGSGDYFADFNGTSADGTRVFFSTQERLVSSDLNDAWYDVYERSGGTTTRVSQGDTSSLGIDRGGSFFVRASEDGSRVFFRTVDRVNGEDQDGAEDIYERSGGVTTRVSTGPNGGNGGFSAALGGISADGTHAFLSTSERLVASDTDTRNDVYERFGGTTTLVSTGPNGGNGAFDASFNANSQDGTRVFFTTSEALAPEDVDTQPDVYERTGGATTLVSTGPSAGTGPYTLNGATGDFRISADGTHALFTTTEQLVAGDTDTAADIYERAGGTTTLVSTGPAGGNGAFASRLAGVSRDGTHVFFTTSESLIVSDTDTTSDLYERAAGATAIVSVGPAGGNAGVAVTPVGFSDDGSRAFFITAESLVSADTDGLDDIFERAGGMTTLISTGPFGGNGAFGVGFSPLPPPPSASASPVSQDGTRVTYITWERLVSSDTDTYPDVYVASTGVTTGYPRPRGATPLFLPLVPVYERCTIGNTTHGAPFAYEACNPPVPASDYLTVGTPDANGQGANSIGSVKLKVNPGNPSTPADEADISLAFSLTDVRKQSDLSDYTGELRVSTSLRITDKLNGSSQALPGTVADMPFAFTVQCAATGDSATGGACTLNTTLDGLFAGAVKESKRSIFKVVGDVEVFDGGADADGETVGDNTLFAGSGLFVP